MFQPGETLESPRAVYTIERKLGEGGFARTYLATDGVTEVALKVLRLERLENWKALELFQREAAALRDLDHPCVPGYVEVFALTPEGPQSLDETELSADWQLDGLVLAQTFRAGESLADRIARDQRLSPAQLDLVVRKVLDTLTYLHELSPPIIHRDITPKNIILDDDGDVSVVDFGAITQSVHAATIGGSTSVGTFGYIPIEQSLGKSKPVSDLYAFGVTLAVVVSGVVPEELPIDDETSKIDIARVAEGLSLAPRFVRLIDALVEPLQTNRPKSARLALELFERGDALVEAPDPGAIEKSRQGSWRTTLFTLALGGSLGSAGIIYPINFNNFSETELVQMSPLWVLPAAFGFFGLLLKNSERPILYAVLATIFSGFMLYCFFAAIFPAL